MKKILLTILLGLLVNSSFSQVTYFNYLDYSSEWRNYGSSFNGVYSSEEFSTTYFDGDTILSGKVYYKKYMLRNIVDHPYSGTVSNLYLNGPTFLREDSAGIFCGCSTSS